MLVARLETREKAIGMYGITTSFRANSLLTTIHTTRMLDESPHYRAVDVNASLKHAIHEPIHAGDYLRL